MSSSDEPGTLRPRRRHSERVTLSVPLDTLEFVRRVAETYDMSPDALLKLYIGQGLRQDAARAVSAKADSVTL